MFARLIATAFVVLLPAAAQATGPALDFRAGAGNDAWQWLAERHFTFERRADDRDKTGLKLTADKGLVVEALGEAQSLIISDKGYYEDVQDIVITWGVDKFPRGASYAKGNRNEAIMIQAYFGTEKIDSGFFAVPDAPYFIALHLCENDEIGKPEKGGYYHEGGRFVCVAQPEPGETVTTRFDLKQAFRDYFGREAPPLHGIAVEFDTNGAPDGGRASGFVQKIELPGAVYVDSDPPAQKEKPIEASELVVPRIDSL